MGDIKFPWTDFVATLPKMYVPYPRHAASFCFARVSHRLPAPVCLHPWTERRGECGDCEKR